MSEANLKGNQNLVTGGVTTQSNGNFNATVNYSNELTDKRLLGNRLDIKLEHKSSHIWIQIEGCLVARIRPLCHRRNIAGPSLFD